MDPVVLLALVESHGDFMVLEDGYVYFNPRKTGAINSNELRIIADELDRRNADWDSQVKRELGIDGNYPNG